MSWPHVKFLLMCNAFCRDVSVLRPSVHSLGVMEGNQVSALQGWGGGEYVINHAINPRFSWREIAQEMAWQSRRVQKPFYFRNLFSSILSIRICDRSDQFLVNCFKKKYMVTNKSGFNSIYMFACKWRATGKRKKRKGREQELTGQEDS